MLSAEPFSGKTLLTIAIALALDSGRPLFNHYQIRERKKVLYLGQDAPSWDYAEQLRKLVRGAELNPPDLDIDFMLNQGINFFDPKSLQLLQDWHSVSNFNVLILDTLNSFHSGDENNTRDMGVLCSMLKHIRDHLRCAIIFTQHTSKPSQGVARSDNYSARGSSVIVGSIDFHIHLRRDSERDRIKIRFPKGRGSERMDRLTYFDIEDATTTLDEPALRLTVPELASSVRNELILSSLPTTRAALVARLRAGDTSLTLSQAQYSIDNSLTCLQRAGRIKKTGRATWEKT